MSLEKAPPLGIEPRYIWEEKRLEELENAIKRYMHNDMVVPVEWTEEYDELMRKHERPILETCPFCGGMAAWMIPTKDWLAQNYGLGDVEAHTIECENCGATTSPYGNRTDAIKAWNRRVVSDKDYMPPVYMRDDLVDIVRSEIITQFRTTSRAATKITNFIEDYFERIWGK